MFPNLFTELNHEFVLPSCIRLETYYKHVNKILQCALNYMYFKHQYIADIHLLTYCKKQSN